MKWYEGREAVINYIVENNLGKRQVNYKLRDWLFSRQRYWGEPFPIVHTEDGPQLLPESSLPISLPEVEKYQPTEDGEPPLANAKDWLDIVDPVSGKPGRRETNTMPQWAGSCWYYLRFIDPTNTEAPWDKKLENYWMPVDLYVGGVEHAVLHLLYSRFWQHVLHDLGLVSTREPFKKLVNQGMILGEDNQKMSKSRGNVINPDDMIKEYGADTLRMYEMFMGPLEQVKPWNTKSAGGVYRFLSRLWAQIIDQDGNLHSKIVDDSKIPFGSTEIEKSLHRLIKKVGEDIESLKFHTAIAGFMTFLNELSDVKEVPKRMIITLVQLLNPFAPHYTEELWERLGMKDVLSYKDWPTYDPELVKLDEVTIAIQVNGKLRETIQVSVNASKDEILSLAKELPKVQGYLSAGTIKKEIVVPGKLVNFVVQ
jgi:leucyl-tRNA synthetase